MTELLIGDDDFVIYNLNNVARLASFYNGIKACQKDLTLAALKEAPIPSPLL